LALGLVALLVGCGGSDQNVGPFGSNTSVGDAGTGDGDGDGDGEGDGDGDGDGDGEGDGDGDGDGDADGEGDGDGDGDGDDGGGGELPECSFHWDFEDCDAGWTTGKAAPAAAGAVSWACGDPTTEPGTAGGHTGQWATNLSGNYNEDESSYLQSPIIDLSACPEASRVYLVVEHWWQMPLGCSSDGGTVQVSDDGGETWQTLDLSWHGYNGTIGATDAPPDGEPGFCDKTENWTTSLGQLENLAGQDDIRIRFVLGSDGISEKLGWYIDAVGVEAYQ
jgi:hypothetical protein